MNRRLLTTPLLASGLLLSTLSCSKKDDPVPKPTASTASYVLNGALTSCTTSSQVTSTSSGVDYLTVILTTTPQPATGAQMLRLDFTKSASQPVAAYQLLQLVMLYGNTISATYTPDTFTITSPSSGNVSGTFSSVSPYSTIPFSLTSGIFTNVPL